MSCELVALALTHYAITHVRTAQTEHNFYVKKWKHYLALLADARIRRLSKGFRTGFEKDLVPRVEDRLR
jgi:hypothetical protein